MNKILFMFFAAFGFLPTLILASPSAGSDPKEISIFLMMTSLFGGLGMFLYGMEMMSNGMKIAAGNKMRSVLEKLTSNRFLAVGVGAFVTMVIQSSSATTVMLVSFVNSGLLTFVQGLGVILGSNIGSTITAQIVAFKVTDNGWHGYVPYEGQRQSIQINFLTSDKANAKHRFVHGLSAKLKKLFG